MVEKLDIMHHQLIATAIILVVFISGIVFGIKLSSATEGTNGMEIIMFALDFLTIVVLFLVFTQLVHVRDALSAKQPAAQPAPVKIISVQKKPMRK